MRGVVQSGGSIHVEPLGGAAVTLYSASDGNTVIVGQATTDRSGEFFIDTANLQSDGIFYSTADTGNGVVLMTIIGRDLPDSITINELTTIAGVWCAAQFLASGEITGDSFALRIAAGMNANIVRRESGESSPVIASPPNADETNAHRLTHSLANFLATAVRDGANARELLFKLATPPGGDAPANTIAAMRNIALHPANQAGGIYAQSKARETYQPALQQQPDAWTIAVKVNDSGDDHHMFGGPGNVAFDQQGRAWIVNNVKQGSGVSTEWSIVLESDGRPARDADGKLLTPFTGGGLLGPGFGVDVDSNGNVWIGDFGWGKDNPIGSVSLFDSNACPLSPEHGYQGGVHRVQGTLVDPSGNIWLASWGNGRVVVYPGGDASAAIRYPAKGQPPIENFKPFSIAIAADSTAWVTNSYSKASSLLHLALSVEDGTLTLLSETPIGQTTKGVVIDSIGTIWVASGGDDHVYAFTPDGTLIGGYQGGGIHGPWGITLDGDDNVWVGNFGSLEVGTVFHGRLTQLAGANAATRRSNRLVGDALTPQTGYTLPSAGSQVRLHNGEPLYGKGMEPCFIPMMRTTGVKVDAAGNVWTCNNWKPDFNMDLFGDPLEDVAANPGGDGMLIWVGLAKPPAKK